MLPPAASGHHLGAHRAALPAGEPFPIPPDVRLRAAFETGRHELPAVSLRFAASGRRPAAAQSPFALRRLRSVPFSPSPFLCHIEFLSLDASDLVIVKRYQSGERARISCTNYSVIPSPAAAGRDPSQNIRRREWRPSRREIYSAGKRISTAVPRPVVLLTDIFPPCPSTVDLAMAMPRPVP